MTNVSYQVRESDKARRLQLSLLPQGKLEVVVPVGFNQGRVPAFIQKHKDWINRALIQHEKQRLIAPELYTFTPETIELKAIEKTWRVRYEFNSERKASQIEHAIRTQTLTVKTRNEQTAPLALKAWLRHMAKRELIPWLESISAQTGLTVNGITVRAQKTRWGSCSHQKKINLNQNLLLLPAAQVEYLFIHELCHTVHLNHSKAYWSLVAKFSKNYRELDRALSKGNRQVPVWAL